MILSLSFCFHDSSVTIANNERILICLEAERVFRKKHFQLTKHEEVEILVAEALKNIDASIDDIGEVLITKFKSIYNKQKRISFLGKIFTPELTSHHNNHIGTALPSGYEKAVIVCADGGSDDGTTKIYYKNGHEYTCVDDLDNTHMTGKFYGAITQIVIHPDHLLAHNHYAGKLMGISALGQYDPAYKEAILKHSDDFIRHHSTEGAKHLREIFAISDNYDKPWEDQKRINLAFTAHKYWVDTFAEYLAKHNAYSRNIALVGGCALNIELNSKLLDDGIYDNVYVSPLSTDAGQSLGAILYKYPHIQCDYPYLGRKFGSINEHYDDKKLLDLLLDEKIVAWYQDRSEIGARALGHRSFIGIPTSIRMKEKLSATIKKREMYRPVAAIIPRNLVSEYFYQEYDSPYMTFCAKAKPVTIEKAPAIVHYDGTTRVQTLTNDDNPVLYALMMKLHEKIGVPILMNTSFNVAGEPIVDTPDDAIRSFKMSGCDALFINGILKYDTPWKEDDRGSEMSLIRSQAEELVSIGLAIKTLQLKSDKIEQELIMLQSKYQKSQQMLATERSKHYAMKQSLSWRMTKPLRTMGRIFGI